MRTGKGKFWAQVSAACAAAILSSSAFADGATQFNRDVLPVLSLNCYPCHGPDANTRKREIRFDTKDGLLGKTLDGASLLVPGRPDESELFKRIVHTDAAEKMPPADSKLRVSEK